MFLLLYNFTLLYARLTFLYVHTECVFYRLQWLVTYRFVVYRRRLIFCLWRNCFPFCISRRRLCLFYSNKRSSVNDNRFYLQYKCKIYKNILVTLWLFKMCTYTFASIENLMNVCLLTKAKLFRSITNNVQYCIAIQIEVCLKIGWFFERFYLRENETLKIICAYQKLFELRKKYIYHMVSKTKLMEDITVCSSPRK